MQSIHDSQLEYVKDKERAKAMFDSLAAVFERKSIAGQLLLRKQLLLMKMSDGESITEHFLKFDKLIRDLKAIGAKMEEMDVVYHLLLTLPKRFDTVVTTIETMSTRDVTLDFVKSRLMDEDSKRNVGSSGKSSESHAMMTKNPDIICYKCEKPGHIKSQCNWRGNKSKKKSKSGRNAIANNASNEANEGESLLCAVASDTSDEANTCAEPVEATAVEAIANKASGECDDVTQIKFVLDSGATEHMANQREFFNSLNRVGDIPISIAKKNENMVSNQRGDIKVKAFDGENYASKTMKNALFVKDLKCNLMSIRNLTKNGCKVVFEGDTATVSKNGKVQFVAHATGKLYEVTFPLEKDVFAGISGEANLKSSTQSLWHFRLGHLNPQDMQKMIGKEMVCGIDKLAINLDPKFCETRVYGKHAKSPFPINKRPRSHRLLELIHTDVCGKMSQPAWDDTEYFVTFVDDFSRASTIFCIANKSDTLEKFKEYVAMAEAQHGVKVSKLRADNGGEYISNEYKEFCKQKGIQLIYTVPYNPKMNGVAERLNRTLVEKARSMLIASGVDRLFWNEAVKTANYLKNRSPTGAYGEQFIAKTPAEIWFGKKPELSHLRIFGSECFNHIPAEKRKKLDTKSSKCILLGYGPSLFTYRLWDIEGDKLVMGRNVIFNEKSVLVRAKMIEISDAEADSNQIGGNNNNSSSQSGHGTANRTGDIDDHSIDSDDAGSSNGSVHSINDNDVGNSTDDIHGVDDDTGNIEPRRSTRTRQQPNWYGIEQNEANFALSAMDYVQSDPISIEQAKRRSDWPEWKRAIDDEYESLMKNRTWTLCDLPSGRKPITNKWVFKLKHKATSINTKQDWWHAASPRKKALISTRRTHPQRNW